MIPVGEGIAGYVAKTGQVVNVKDAYTNTKFNKAVDKITGFVTRSVCGFQCYQARNL